MSDPTPPPSAPKKRRPAARKRKPAKKAASVASAAPVPAEAEVPQAADAGPVTGSRAPAADTVQPAAPPRQETRPENDDTPRTEAEPVRTESPSPEARPSPERAPQQQQARSNPERAAQQQARSRPKHPPSRSGEARTPAPADVPVPVELIRVPLSVRWRDLDAFNHVNNSKYLSYLEEARLRWMMTMPGMGLDDDVAPVVAASNLNYRRPISWPGDVVIELFVERIGNTSVTIGHRILDAGDGSVNYCDGTVVLVWIDRRSGRAAPLPEAVRMSCSNVARNGG